MPRNPNMNHVLTGWPLRWAPLYYILFLVFSAFSMCTHQELSILFPKKNGGIV